MNKRLLTQTLSTPVILLHHIVYLADRRADQEREEESEDIPMSRPKEDVDRVEDAQKGEAPLNRVDDDLFPAGSELEDHGSEEEEVDEGPNPECVSTRCQKRGLVHVSSGVRSLTRGR